MKKPLPQYKNDFLQWLAVEKGLSSKTQENYSRFLKRFFNWLKIKKLENLKPEELTLDHVREYRAYLATQRSPKTDQDLKKSTQNYYLIALRSLLSYFADMDIPCLSVEKIKLAKNRDERQISFLNLEQLEKLLQAPDIKSYSGLRDRAMLEILFSTGMRISELINLNRNQFKIKPETKELEISIIGKGGRLRTVYFSERALLWLKKYLKTRDDKDEALFINYRGRKDAPKRLTARGFEKRLKKYVIASGVPINTTPHSLRHTFSTDLLNKGVDIRTLQEFLGHKSILATQIYAHVTNKRLREIHKKYHSGKDLN